MASAGPTDEEKTLMELQDRLLASTQTLARLNQQDRMALTRKQRTELTLSELKQLPDGARTYKSIGKAYFLSSKDNVVTESQAIIASVSSEIDALRAQRNVVETKLKETQVELRELVNANPAVLAQFRSMSAR
eukprot:CAMPEP_0119107574 /NCGR_PEP_ID=MMETSP1180-20130426/11293_1 /TAXON_ID=3052 ORGANISM="Chlamydomonas cf sp, Strain CCMP681" /NCGR_SAMPLE_ID=MMETSP1180 /ASSEMBLY_ACC=CAM_ASM_000741 /LENGTH=132 /DNA_ID=CAMNT_0007093083 /DNA_START=89 /DNA_END=487 /DNA_ORIENTATION=-